MARPEKIAGFSEPFADEIVRSVEWVKQQKKDMRTARRQRPGEEGATGTGFEAFVIVCLGPDDEVAPTDNSYWAQPLTIPDTSGTDPPEVTSAGTIILVWNLAEAQTESHGLHVGTVLHEVWQQVDAGGNTLNLCNQVP